MLKKIITVILIMLITFAVENTAQNKKGHKHTKVKWDEYRFFDWQTDSNPFIELHYGLGKMKQKNFNEKFSDIGMAEIMLGYNNVDQFMEDYLIDFSDKFAFVSNFTTDMKSKNNPDGLDSELWRFGFGGRSGYGYQTGALSILPYEQSTFAWNRLRMREFPAGDPLTQNDIDDLEIINRYNDAFRFGSNHEAGIRFEVASFVSLNAGYEASVIFPRYLIWKHAGSYLIEKAGAKALDYFIDEIIDSSPAAGPIINFILKNAYAYGFYQLQKDRMNWPFASEMPLTYETFKLGLTFVF